VRRGWKISRAMEGGGGDGDREKRRRWGCGWDLGEEKAISHEILVIPKLKHDDGPVNKSRRLQSITH
jgi:hypothetical protein